MLYTTLQSLLAMLDLKDWGPRPAEVRHGPGTSSHNITSRSIISRESGAHNVNTQSLEFLPQLNESVPSGSGVCSRSSTVSACAVRPPMAPRRSQLRAAARRWRHRVRECPTGRRSGAVPSYVGGASHVNGEHSIAARLARGDFAFLTSNLRTWREKDRQSRAQNPRRPR